MALDEPRDNDKVFEVNGLTYLVDTGLMEQVSPIKVDFMENDYQCGFAITSGLARNEACGGACSC